ncbi:MAG TPA: alanine racemase [Acidisarcina sp.]|nr:alanine racemase [Acidisarcina sp.]
MSTRPTWVEISRQSLLANYHFLRQLADRSADLLAVVKADAYGHGLEHCAPILADAGAEWLGITSVEEGVCTRSLCPGPQRILVISGLWHGEAGAVLEHDLTPVVWEHFHLDELEAAAAQRGLGPQSVAVHLEIDTGMARQGVAAPYVGADGQRVTDAPELKRVLERFHPQSPLRLEGIMTHFSAADDLVSGQSEHQMARLAAALEYVAAAGLQFHWLHAGASATLLDGQDLPAMAQLASSAGARLMLRPGLALYGYSPRFSPPRLSVCGEPGGESGSESAGHLQPVLTWKTRVVSMRSVPPGEGVSYNGTFRTERPTRLALLAVGYADGLNRLLSNRASFLVRGERAPIAGRICMDQCLLDVTDIPAVEIGDEVTILAGKETGAMDASDHADLLATIPWEVLCDIGPRVPRLLVD